MDKKREEMILNAVGDKLKNPQILPSLDKKAMLGCNLCGECCKNREDIVLKVWDIRNICKAKEIRFSEIASRYCDIYIGDNSKLPVVSVDFERVPLIGETICPFLKSMGDNKFGCEIDSHKPNVCRLYPLAKITIGDIKDSSKIDTIYVSGEMDCLPKEEMKMTSLGEWIGDQDLNTKWTNAMMVKVNLLQSKFKVSEKNELYMKAIMLDDQVKSAYFDSLFIFMYYSDLDLSDEEAFIEYADLESESNRNCLYNLEKIARGCGIL